MFLDVINPIPFVSGLVGIPAWILYVLLFLALAYIVGTWDLGKLKAMGISHPSPYPFIGNMDYLVKKGMSYDPQMVKQYGKVFGYYEIKQRPVIVIADADIVKDITVKKFDKFVNRRVDEFPIAPEIRDSVSLLKNDAWKGARNVITPTFSASKMKKMTYLIIQCAKDFVGNLDKRVDDADVEIKDLCGCYTMDAIGRAQFGVEVDSADDPNNPFVQNAKAAFHDFSFGSPTILLILLFPSLKPVFEYFNISTIQHSILKFFADRTYSLIDVREKMEKKPVDFLQLMLDAHKFEEPQQETNETSGTMYQGAEQKDWRVGKRALSRMEILANSIIFLLVGYETTASALSWMFHFMALNEECQEKLRQEVESVMEDHGGEATYEAVAKMEYLEQCFCETLRFYPSVQRSDRICNETCEIGGYTIPKGQIINIGIFAMHRDPDYWVEPEKFDPERFSPENKSKIVPYSYCPFGSGPRNCIGMRLAILEVKVALCYAITKFRFMPSDKTEVNLPYSLE